MPIAYFMPASTQNSKLFAFLLQKLKLFVEFLFLLAALLSSVKDANIRKMQSAFKKPLLPGCNYDDVNYFDPRERFEICCTR